ncbi:MAG: PQQ-binding-like beta-propeller repeat protein [Maribacter sp.]
MKNIKTILFACSTILFISCNKDDGPSTNRPIEETFEELILPDGTIALSDHSKSFELSFEGGTISEEKNLIEDQQIKNYRGDVFLFSANVIQRTARHPEERSWSREFLVAEGESIKIHQADIVFSGATMFISYQIVNTTTYSSTSFIEAIDVFNSDILWKIQVDHKTELHMYQDRFITVQRPNGNAGITFQFRNKTLGTVEGEKIVEDRIDRYLFDGDLIIANSWQNRVFALDRALNTVWSFETDGANTIHSLVFENEFIFHSRDGNLYALDKNTGSLQWKKELSNHQVLGIQAENASVYIGQHTDNKTLTISRINLEDGSAENSFQTGMSEDYYTTQLHFHEDYLLLVTSPTSDESDIGIEAQLIHLPSSQEVWKTNLNLFMWSLDASIETYTGLN